MARREWAEKEVTKRLSDGWSGDALVMGRNEAMDMLIKQHARAVRIVKKVRWAKRPIMKSRPDDAWFKGYETACNEILAKLQKGRA